MKKILAIVFSLSILISCDFISNTLTYENTTQSFIDTLLKEEYDKSLEFMSLENEAFNKSNVDSLKLGLATFRKIIDSNFGDELNYKFITANKTFSTVEGESTAPNTTKAQVEFSNNQEFGVLEITFDDSNNKILYIRTLDIKEKIPNMTLFWAFGILALFIPIFNIWVIRKIKKSDLQKKWIKYITVIFLNVPAVSFSAINGLSVSLLSFQILFGISFSYMGYLNSIWSFGLPLGGIYWLWKLHKKGKENSDSVIVDEMQNTE